MKRRKFFILAGAGLLGASGLYALQIISSSNTKKIIKSTIIRLKPFVTLPDRGEFVSVETALNSRCSSDNDQNPKKFHWGMFDRFRQLSNEQIVSIVARCIIPRFTSHKVRIIAEKNLLTFTTENSESDSTKDWMMVESGMQQQTVGLVSAALGVGIVFKNMGKDGTPISGNDFGTIKMKLDPMKPSYNGSFWSDSPPEFNNPWTKGSLKDPKRKGGKPLISCLSGLKTTNQGTAKITDESISQLLWAARGRTPHLYNGKTWGLTIPTWQGKQDITSLYFVFDTRLYQYINWANNKPTHTLQELKIIKAQSYDRLSELFSIQHGIFVIGKNEIFGRALWEVGYQLMNLLLQADSLDISYRSKILNERERTFIESLGISSPVAIFSI